MTNQQYKTATTFHQINEFLGKLIHGVESGRSHGNLSVLLGQRGLIEGIILLEMLRYLTWENT